MGEEIILLIIVITIKTYNLVLVKNLKTSSLEVNYASEICKCVKDIFVFFLCLLLICFWRVAYLGLQIV